MAEDVPIPTGLQTLLSMAAVHEEFLEGLVSHGLGQAMAAGVSLSASEQAMFAAIDEEQLRDMVRCLPAPTEARRAELLQAASGAVVSAEPSPPRREDVPMMQGIRPDPPPSRPSRAAVSRGISPVGVLLHRIGKLFGSD